MCVQYLGYNHHDKAEHKRTSGQPFSSLEFAYLGSLVVIIDVRE